MENKIYVCKFCGKKFNSKQKLGGHIIWCKENPNRSGKSNFKSNIKNGVREIDIPSVDLFCQYCGKQCKSLNSLRQHEIRCKENPNKVGKKNGKGGGGFIGYNEKIKNGEIDVWNKGLKKETDERVKKNAESISNSYKLGIIKVWCEGLTKDTDDRIKNTSDKISSTIMSKVKIDAWHNSFGKSKIITYNGVDFHGSWEVEFAKYLDNNNICWERNIHKFEYYFENKIHYYTPDFYLLNSDVYVEIKGYPTERDFCKWNCFPENKKLNIYFGDELFDMGIISNYRNVYNNVLSKYRVKHNIF